MSNDNRFFNNCKKDILGYTVEINDGSYDDTLDYVSVTAKFYIKGETSNRIVCVMKSCAESMICDTLVEKVGFLNEIDPYETSFQLRNEGENE